MLGRAWRAHADFLELTPDEVVALLADPAKLGVAHEEAVFEAAMRWVRHDRAGPPRPAAAPAGARDRPFWRPPTSWRRWRPMSCW